MSTECPVEIWHDCYSDNWKGMITTRSFAHPAKMAYGLLSRILDFGLQHHYWRPGQIVADPFFGIGTLGVLGAYHGLRIVGVELEPCFCDMARENLQLHKQKWQALRVPMPVLIQGDSRQFARLVREALTRDVGKNLPPYVSGGHHEDVNAAITSPPYASSLTQGNDPATYGAKDYGGGGQLSHPQRYGGAEGQIGDLPCGDSEVEGLLTSPPFSPHQPCQSQTLAKKDYRAFTQDRTCEDHAMTTEGNLQQLPLRAGDLDAAITSPPYSEGLGHNKAHHASNDAGRLNDLPESTRKKIGKSDLNGRDYGNTSGQIGSLVAGQLDSVVTSPPYAETTIDPAGNFQSHKCPDSQPARNVRPRGYEAEVCSFCGHGLGVHYGRDQKCSLCECRRSCTAIISSPPYAESISGDHAETETARDSRDARRTPGGSLGQACRHGGYGVTDGQIGTLKDEGKNDPAPETYWSAMSLCYRQMWLALKPHGVAAIVVKNYVRDGQIIPLCDQTCRLLEYVGFEVFLRIKAMLVKEVRTPGLFGTHVKRTARKSFFRRLHETRRPDLAIDFEEVIWCRKRDVG